MIDCQILEWVKRRHNSEIHRQKDIEVAKNANQRCV